MTIQTIMILMLMNVPPTVSTTTRIIVLVLQVKFVTGVAVCTAEVDDVVGKSVLYISVCASVTV